MIDTSSDSAQFDLEQSDAFSIGSGQSEDEDVEDSAHVPLPAEAIEGPSSVKRTLFDYFCPRESAGFDQSFREAIELEVAGFVAEAEKDAVDERSRLGATENDEDVGRPITEPELESAQRQLKQTSRHGRDLVPNAALKISVPGWRLLLLAMLNAVMSLYEYAEQWRHVQLAPLLKSGKRRTRHDMDDFRPIGLMACIAKLLEQVMLPRVYAKLAAHLGADQGGGSLGADACALFLWELLALRRASRCPDAFNGFAATWVAFLDISSFYDKVWRHGLLHRLWHAGVRGRTFLILRSYLEITVMTVLVAGAQSEAWATTLGLIQGSVLAMLLASLYLSGLQQSIQAAGCGARWFTADGKITTTHSRFYIDDGILPAESQQALQRMLDAACAWARRWRVTFRVGINKSAAMCTKGMAAMRRAPMYITSSDGCRVALPAVGVYKYLGVSHQWNLEPKALVQDLLATGHSRTATVATFARKNQLPVTSSRRLWDIRARSALRFQAAFCPIDAGALAPLDRAMYHWSRIILGWEPALSGLAALGDLGWPQCLFFVAEARVALIARVLAPASTLAMARLQELLQAASGISGTWTASSLSTVTSVLGQSTPPIGAAAWRAVSLIALGRLRKTEAQLWATQVQLDRGLQHYVQGTWAHGQCRDIEAILYGSRCSGRHPGRARTYGRMRAGAPVFGNSPASVCPACGDGDTST